MYYNSISKNPYIKTFRTTKGTTLIELDPIPYFCVQNICLAYMNMFARFDENPAMTLHDIKETKCYARTHGRTHERTHARTDNVKTVYLPQTKLVGGIIIWSF